MNKNFTRRTFLFSSATVLAATQTAAAASLDDTVQLSKLQLTVGTSSSKKIRIGVLTDIHLTGDEVQEKPFLDSLALIQAESPDLLILGGDYILVLDQLLSKSTYSMTGNTNWFKEDVGYSQNRGHVRNIFRTVAEKVTAAVGSQTPVLAILGNHDNWHGPEICAEEFQKANIRLLVNNGATVQVKGTSIFLYGTDDFGTGITDTAPAQASDLKIFLSHNPDFFSIGEPLEDVSGYDLLLSGHSHGGQVVLPVLGAPFSNLYDQSHLAGWSKACGKPLYTSRGIGTSGIPLRYNCPPETVIIDISC